VITPRRDLDDEHTRLLTYDRARAASIEHLDAVASVSAGMSATTAGPMVWSDIHPAAAGPLVAAGQLVAADQFAEDQLAAELTYRAALAALSGVVQRSLRDFLA
jgi:hypothetical protein